VWSEKVTLYIGHMRGRLKERELDLELDA